MDEIVGNPETKTWTEERTKRLKQLAADGCTASQIASELDCGLSRNAVIGKIARDGISWSGRVARQTHFGGLAQRSYPPRAPRPKSYPPKAKASAPLRQPYVGLPAESQRIRSVLLLSNGTCKFPFGDPGDREFFFCGAPPAEGKVYCSGHCAIAYSWCESATRQRRC